LIVLFLKKRKERRKHRIFEYGCVYTHTLRKELRIYRQLMYVSEMRKEKVGNMEGRKREGASLGDQSCGHTSYCGLLCPLNSPSPQGNTRQMDPQETKNVNKVSFLFDLEIPDLGAGAQGLFPLQRDFLRLAELLGHPGAAPSPLCATVRGPSTARHRPT
jgi:hypothetical protein